MIGFARLLPIKLVEPLHSEERRTGAGDLELLDGIGVFNRTVRLVHFCRSTDEIVFVLINVGVRERPLAADTAIPFGPFLAAGGWVVWVNGSVPF